MRTETGYGRHIYKQLFALHRSAVRSAGSMDLPGGTYFTEENGCSPIATGLSSYCFNSNQERLVVTCGAVSLPQVLCP